MKLGLQAGTILVIAIANEECVTKIVLKFANLASYKYTNIRRKVLLVTQVY